MADLLDVGLLNFLFSSSKSVADALKEFILLISECNTLEEARILEETNNELAILFSILEKELKTDFDY